MFLIAVYVILVLVILQVVLKSGYIIYTYDGAECLAGKVAIITGGNRGIGYEVSKCLASRGCKIIIACRSNAENEIKELIKLTHNENITVKYLDLKSFESVRNFSNEIHRTEDKIDILINNAGIAVDSGLTADGLHPVMQTNVFAPFLLTHLLADLLKRSDDARIVFSSSVLAFYNNLKLENLSPILPEKYDKAMSYYFQMYGNSKLGQLIVSNALSAKLSKYGVKSNTIHPGMINTDIWHGLEIQNSPTFYETIFKWILYITIFFFSRTPQEGAQGIVALAASDRYKDTTGQFYWGFRMCNIYPNPKILKDKNICNEIVKKIESLTQLNTEEML